MPPARKRILRVLISLVAALVTLLVILPLIYDLSGVRTNLEERIAPTLIAGITRKTRPPRTPIPSASENTPVVPIAPPLEPTEIPLPLPTVSGLNGIPVEHILSISDSARENIRDIYALGQALGRNPRAVSKIGDSTMVYPPFLATFDRNTYRLGRFGYLQDTVNYHAGSFGRASAAVKIGMHTWSQFDPSWAPPEMCLPGEGPLACELRLHNPSIAFIRLGANDTTAPTLFEKSLGEIVRECLARGIVPVLGTKPDRYEGPSNRINNLIRRTASAYRIPLWDYDLIMGTIPGRGLEQDGLHIRGGGTRNFNLASAMQAGDALEDLTALMFLDALRRELGLVEQVAE